MERIIVIGCPGSGKSRFSRALGEATGLPVIHLDRMYWNEDKTTVGRELFLERLSAVLQSDKWIIDGNYSSTIQTRLLASDTVVFLDFKSEVCLLGIRERRGKARADMPWIETEEDPEFTDFVRRFGADERPRILELLAKYPSKRTIILKSREEADAFLLGLQKQITVNQIG